MLTVWDHVPEELLHCQATDLYQVLPGPTLIHLPGKRHPALFVSVLLHGNEVTGWLAVRKLLQHFSDRALPRSLSLLIGNVQAARYGMRRLTDQPDYNRIWIPGDLPEHHMAAAVIAHLREWGVFACVDVHNNTGRNPHYACVCQVDPQTLQLATLFGRTVLYFTEPAGVQTMALSALAPAVTLECGKPDHPHGIQHAYQFLYDCLHLDHLPNRPVPPQDLHLLHTIATVKVPPQVSFGFGAAAIDVMDLAFPADLDELNFQECPAHTPIARVRTPTSRLEVRDTQGNDVAEQYFYRDGDQLRTRQTLFPAMLTVNSRIIRQDCLGYLLEEYPLEYHWPHTA